MAITNEESSLPEVVGKILAERKLTIAVAESCTGGLLCSLITDIAGSSRYFLSGVVAYSNESKVILLGVSKETLKKYGAVSPEIAKEMAEGIRKKNGASIGISVTGVAGPDGGSEEKPVGTLHIAIASDAGTSAHSFLFHRDRLAFKSLAATTALDLTRTFLTSGSR